MSDEDAKSASHTGTCDGDVEEIKKALDYWHTLDFLSQGNLPNELSVKRGEKVTLGKSLADRFAPALADVEDGDRALISLVKERLEKILSAQDKDQIASQNIFVYLGRIPREEPVAYLFRDIEDPRIEKETGQMAAAILGLTSTGEIESFELSPLLWLTGEDASAKVDIRRYAKCNDDIMGRLKDYTSPLTVSDVRQIVQSEIIDPYLRPINDYQRQLKDESGADEGRPSGAGKCEVPDTDADIEKNANALLFDYQVRTEEEGDYKVSFEGFYTEDIDALSKRINNVKSLDALREGPLALVAQYLEAGLEGQAAQRREVRRKSVLPTDASDNEDCLEVYRDKMGYGAMPLGRWPSRYSLSFMQQLGVNLVAPGFAELNADEGGWQGRHDACDESCAHYDAPQRIWSVNGPPGTGKTTLLKDIVAANVVEKARLLCKYDDPDRAFEDEPIAFPNRKDGYIAGCDGVFRLRDDEVSDLGIVVCSSNNAAVENISKELPKAEGLLAGVDEDEKKAFLDENDSLAHVRWSPRKKDEGEPRMTRDLYFSFPAHNQFRRQNDRVVLKDYNDEDDANLDLLLAARLGRKRNIDAFLYGSLKTLYWNAPYLGGRKPSAGEPAARLGRYKKAREEFQNQYEKVEHELAVFAEYERLSRRLEEALDDYRQARAEYDVLEQECRSAREDDLGTLRDIARRCGLDVKASALDTSDELKSLCDELVRRTETHEADRELREKKLSRAKERLEEVKDAREKAQNEVKKAKDARKEVKDALFVFHRDSKLRAANESVTCAEKAMHDADEAVDRAKTAVDDAEHALKVFDIDHRKEARCAQGAEELRAVLGAWYENEDECDAARARANKLAGEADSLKKGCDDLGREAKAQRVWLAGPSPQFLRDDDGDLSDGGFDYDGFIAALTSEDDDTRKRAHLFNPISNPDILRDRDLLFIKALRLTREFILASKCMKSNLRYLMAYWGAADTPVDSGDNKTRKPIRLSDLDAKAVVPALFQSLNLLTPVISTTFASAHRLFKDVPITGERADAPLGLLVIDEAGQALPYAALGVLARCRRAMVVGDPFQIEPVVAQEAKVLRPILAKDIPLAYKQDCASVQRLADAANPYGQSREDEDGDSTWVGCPLVVHRRCISPMFDISNEVAYQNTMLNETRPLSSDNPADKQRLDRFYLPSSQWINVAGNEGGRKNHYVAAQGERVAEIVVHAFEKKPDGPSLFVISPFTTVKEGVKRALGGCKPASVSGDAWDTFLANNIGTVHTFQGKEADEVVFVLGCDKDAPGAVQFVGLNIVNVAASRAKHRLYVVGDYNVWQRNDHVATMKRILDTAWVKHWKAYQAEPSNECELRLACQMQPQPDSFPLVDEGTDSDEATPEGKHKREGGEPADECPSLDTSAYVANMSGQLKGLGLEDYFEFYGFASAEELERALFASIELPDADRGFILDNLKLAKLHYDVALAGKQGCLSEDFSACLIHLCRAVELYLEACALPLFRDGEAQTAKKGKAKSPSVGLYAKNMTEQQERLARWTLQGFGPDKGAAAKGVAPQWWGGLAHKVNKFSSKRNDVCHPGKRKIINLEFANMALSLLFQQVKPEIEACGGRIREAGGACASDSMGADLSCGSWILSEGDVLAAALCGKEREPDLPCEPSADVPLEVEEGAEVTEACEPTTDPAVCPDTSPVPSPESAVAFLPEAEEAPELPSEPRFCDASNAPFCLEDARSESNDGCLSFSAVNTGDACEVLLSKLHPEGPVKGRAAATLVLDWLDSRGYIETRNFEQGKDRYPTAQGYAVGIRWRVFMNERKGSQSAGVVFNEAAQKWLVEEAPGLIDGPTEGAGR